uniref:LRRNT domain-containing protein n=1 Tax=Oryzias sinensis TaxID=183150 RepID=A0A8C7YSY1_9TELE
VAQTLRLLLVVLLLTFGVTASPVISTGCPDRCVCDDQLVVQCAGQHLTTFPVNLPLATRQLIISNNRIVELPPLALNYLSDLGKSGIEDDGYVFSKVLVLKIQTVIQGE